MKLIRLILGSMILFLDRTFSPSGLQRDPQAQSEVDQALKFLTLYQLEACPFCVKVRREMKRLSLQILIRDVGKDSTAYQELMAGGKMDQVPCLRIQDAQGQVRWMYESDEINEYLRKRFGSKQLAPV